MKLRRNRRHAENQNEKVQGIHRPAKKRGYKSVALLLRQPAKVTDDGGGHRRQHIRMIPANS
jgi:hypothetical protein